MKSTSKPCPDQQTLLQFIQGRLEPPTLDQCEEHLSDCQSCHETLRGLDVNDTLSQYVSKALEHSLTENVSDSQAIDGLMHRLLEPSNLRKHRRGPAKIDSEIMADRAAEVLRCIDPPTIGDDDSLGTLGDYRLLRLIGAGGSGVVFQARDISLDRLVALKVLRPSLGEIARDRFIAEARLAASIEHDNVVTIYQIGQQDRLAFIAMQWVPGETLETRLGRESKLTDEATVREFVSQIASGLSAAHKRQLIHRDIKPANIWICEATNRIKILDFGLARIADEESSLTQTGMLAGTPSFMSPEQTKGMELDPRSDLFSLGCVMYKLLTGRLPFSATTVLGTLQTIQSDSPQPPIAINLDCNADLSDLTMNLLEKLPGNRMASAENLIHCLASNRSNWPQVIPKAAGTLPVPSATAPKTLHRNGVRTWLTAAILLGFLATPAWLFAPQIYRIATNQGELVVETSDENIKVQVLKNGEEVNILDSSTGNSIEIAAGQYTFNATKEGSESEFEVTPKSVIMTRGGKQLVTVTISETTTKEPEENGTVSTSDSKETIFPYVAFALKDSTPVYGLNSETAKTGNSLTKEQRVDVYKHTNDGWCAIKPPKGSFSYVKYSAVSPKRAGEITTVSEDKTRIWIGTSFMNTPFHQWNPLRHNSAPTHSADDPVSQVELNKGDRVFVAAHVLLPGFAGSPRKWYQIEPPSGEFRWVRQSDLEPLVDDNATASLIPRDAVAPTKTIESATSLLDKRISEQFRNSGNPDLQLQALNAKIASMKVEREMLVARVGSGHPSVDEIDLKIESTKRHFEPLVRDKEAPIYGGRNFDQWLQIAKNDREPKTVSDAIAACGVLAEGEQKSRFLKQLRKLVRMHGTAYGQEVTNGGAANTANIYITGFLKALDQLEVDEVVDFIQVEIEAGNEQSLGFCSRIFQYLDFDDDRTKTLEFFNTVALDTNPLMKRIYQRDIKVDVEVISFLRSCFRSKTDADIATCLQTISSLDASMRPEFYSTLMARFPNGELNDAIIADFFADSISGSTRESYFWSILFIGNASYGFSLVSENWKSLKVQILTEAITRLLKSDAPELKFDSYRDIWFDQNRVIETVKDENGNINWTPPVGTLVKTKPEGAKQIQGQAAIVRHLLTRLCLVVGAGTLKDKDRELVLNFVKLATGSENKAINDLIDSPDSQELLIAKDLKNLRNVANGEKKEEPFTYFAKEQKSSFGGGGGYGGGGSGGIF